MSEDGGALTTEICQEALGTRRIVCRRGDEETQLCEAKEQSGIRDAG